jgi:arylsulfatase A-like enzyme
MVWPGPGTAYSGYLNDSCLTIAEALQATGYQTFMSGKWHVGGNYDAEPPQRWRPGTTGYPIPLQRGFDRFFGTLTGSGSYYQPSTLMRQDHFVDQQDPDWYYTDAIAEEACAMINGRDNSRPFFLYLAFTAPHWPLHARRNLIDGYLDVYRPGWDRLREERYERLVAAGLIDPGWRLSPRDHDAWPWADAILQDWEVARMAAYAAQVEAVDHALGQVIDTAHAALEPGESAMVLVLSDNGGCSELLREDVVPDGQWPSSLPLATLDGRPVRFGNRPDTRPGSPDTFASYDVCWANLSNAPFRRFKRWVHEGGISTPFIMSWPGRVPAGTTVRFPAHIIDVMPTLLAAAGTSYPGHRDGHPLPALAGISLLDYVGDAATPPDRMLFFEHEGHRALRAGDWKLVSVNQGDWELYNMERDRTELVDHAAREKARVQELAQQWGQWAASVGADPSVFADIDLVTQSYVSINPALRHRYRRASEK